ncbi:MAG: type I-U CRISPR-associated RAMP protein Csb1/Cas7u [Gemmataceae bacterium]|nr:type I-U CRISPR-associated RAMP protein Csb1/Cas7u [Gemmataceae bacterium]
MPALFSELSAAPRVLVEAALQPVAGSRIQPTGFPDLGPAVYDAPDGNGGIVATLLVESAQSMANRLEAVCWDDASDDIATELKGLPFVRVALEGPLAEGENTTSSLLEFHRLNSPYIMSGFTKDSTPFIDVMRQELGLSTVAKEGAEATEGDDDDREDVAGVVNLRKLAAVCFKYDPNSLVHGVFLEKIAGRLRHPRALSAFIEATGVGRADSGGVKFDRALPKPKVAGVDAAGGYGNVPFHRTEFTAGAITAYFSIDLAQLRGYGLKPEATDLLVALSLWKVRKFLESNMRLRSACELELKDGVGNIRAKRPKDYPLPSSSALAEEIGTLIEKCKPHFAKPPVTELTWNGGKPAKEKKSKTK